MNFRPVLAPGFVCLVAVLGSCSGSVEVTQRSSGPVTYNLRFSAQGSAGDVGLSCRLQGLVTFPDSLRAGASVRGQGHLSFERSAYHGPTSVVTSDGWTDENVILEYVDSAHVRLVIEGTFTDTVAGFRRTGADGPAFAGDWRCGPRLPFHGDSLLLAAGWNRVGGLAGVWSAEAIQQAQ